VSFAGQVIPPLEDRPRNKSIAVGGARIERKEDSRKREEMCVVARVDTIA
tara:strand:+ start:1829 stop:1978 length:150 start_codon:yes stop_codon:yes gene_type:complete